MSVLASTSMLIYLVTSNLMTHFDSCNVNQSVRQPTHLHGYILDLILSPYDQDTVVDFKISELLSDHAVMKCYIDFHKPSNPNENCMSPSTASFSNKLKSFLHTNLSLSICLAYSMVLDPIFDHGYKTWLTDIVFLCLRACLIKHDKVL